MFRFDVNKMQLKTPIVSFNANLVAPVERLASELFAQNDAGWVSNQVSTLMKTQNLQQYQMLLSALKDNPKQYGIQEGMTIRDAIDFLKPRYAQSDVELIEFGRHVIDSKADKMDAAYRKALEKNPDDVLQSKVDDVKPVDNVQTE